MNPWKLKFSANSGTSNLHFTARVLLYIRVRDNHVWFANQPERRSTCSVHWIIGRSQLRQRAESADQLSTCEERIYLVYKSNWKWNIWIYIVHTGKHIRPHPTLKNITINRVIFIGIRGHSTTTRTKFWPILTPSPPRVEKRGHLKYPPPLSTWTKGDLNQFFFNHPLQCTIVWNTFWNS